MQFCTAISYNRMKRNLEYDIIHKSISYFMIQIIGREIDDLHDSLPAVKADPSVMFEVSLNGLSVPLTS